MARIASTDSLKITLAFASQVFMFPDVSHLSPSLLYHSDPALASAQTGSQTRHLYLWENKTSAQTLVAGTYFYEPTRGYTLQLCTCILPT